MPTAKKRRVTVRRAEAGAHDPLRQAFDKGILEGRARSKAEYVRIIAAAVDRAKADERAVRDEIMVRMEKEIEDLTLRCAVLEQQRDNRSEGQKPQSWSKQDNREWIAQFDEDNDSMPDRPRGSREPNDNSRERDRRRRVHRT